MRFYTKQHKFYCGVDLHARALHVCILNQADEKVFHRGVKASPRDFLWTVGRLRDDLVVGPQT